MNTKASPQPNLLQGALDLLILHALQRGPLHGYSVAASWGASENNRKAKYYRITKRGQKLLAGQAETWSRLSGAAARVLAR